MCQVRFKTSRDVCPTCISSRKEFVPTTWAIDGSSRSDIIHISQNGKLQNRENVCFKHFTTNIDWFGRVFPIELLEVADCKDLLGLREGGQTCVIFWYALLTGIYVCALI